MHKHNKNIKHTYGYKDCDKLRVCHWRVVWKIMIVFAPRFSDNLSAYWATVAVCLQEAVLVNTMPTWLENIAVT